MIKVLFALLLMSAAFAQLEDGAPLSNGRLSFIEDQPEIGGEGDPRRALPFVEVTDVDALQPCLDQGFDSDQCETFEYSVPFLPFQAATEVEKAVVDAWYRFETRTKHRVNAETGQNPPLIACVAGLGALDIRHLMYEGQLFYPASEFCDGLESEILPGCMLECDVPLAFCPSAPGACNGCIRRQYYEAKTHSLSTYYPEYIQDVTAALAQNMALALPWRSPLITPGGSLTAPIFDVNLPFAALVDMAAAGAEEDPRAPAYFFQAGAMNNPCQAVMPPTVLDILRRLPGDRFDPTAPGLKHLEKYKRTLADREDAGDTQARFDYWWNGKDNLYPKYTAAGPPAFGVGGEDARLALGPPLLHACMGYAIFFQVRQDVDVITKPVPGFSRRAMCLKATPPFVGVTIAKPLDVFWTFEGPRFHTAWHSVPEGFDIPGVEGEPLY